MDKQHGFTLIELMVTLAIAAIVITVGVPSFRSMVRDIRIAAHTNEFIAAFNMARSEAIKRGERVILLPNTASDWGKGWRIVHDANNNGKIDTGETVLRQFDAFPNNAGLIPNQNIKNYISFDRNGITRFAGSDAFQAGTFVLSICDDSDRQVNIVVNSVGRAQVTKKPVSAVACTK